jgi:hypothetical protein
MRQNKKLIVLIVTWSLVALFGSENVLAQTLGSSAQQTEKSKQEILSSENGRFVFGQISDSSKDQFMLDTVTGRLWRIAETGEIGMFLRAIPYRNDEGDISHVPEEISAGKD